MPISGRPWLESYPSSIKSSLDYPEVSLGQLLADAVGKKPDVAAMIFEDQTITYREFGDRVDRLARGLADLGIKYGERVSLLGPNCPQWIISFYALLKLGAVIVQTNPMYVERELAYQMNDSGATSIIVLDQLYPRVKNIRAETPLQRVIAFSLLTPLQAGPDYYSYDELLKSEPAPPAVTIDPANDLAVLQYTGGTTGVSKGVMLTHRNLISNAIQTINWFSDIKYGEERVMTVLPIFHIYALTVCVNYAVALAATQIIMSRFDLEQMFALVDKYRPTLFPGAPTIYMAIVNHPKTAEHSESLSSIKACISGSAPLPQEVAQRFGVVTQGGFLAEGYGLSEASPVTHCNPLDRLTRKGSIGLPFPDTDSAILDLETGTRELGVGEIGELCVKGPQVMRGYWNRPEETRATLRDGWLHTGDIAKMDEEGFFYIIDRKKDMIIAGGFNIYPRDIEEVLYEHPKVKEVVVAGIPDAYRGETVKAYIVLRDQVEASEEEFTAFCRSKMAAYKVPRLFEFRQELPRSVVGKVLRRQLVGEEKAKLEAAAGE